MTVGAAAKAEPVVTHGGKPPKADTYKYKPEHKNSRATRRGPMDEMRQLIRILAKLMPHSEPYLRIGGEDTNGGNRVSEEQIRNYLATSLGEAPQPAWGLPQGWGQYLADLFNWAKGTNDITAEEARRCAKRGTGRPWEAVWFEVHRLGVFPEQWPLPLSLEAVQTAQIASQMHASAAGLQGVSTGAAEQPQTQMLTRKRSSLSTSAGDATGNAKRAKNSNASEAGRSGSNPQYTLEGVCSSHQGFSPDQLLQIITSAAMHLQNHPITHRGDLGRQTEAVSALMAAMPSNVNHAVVSQNGGLQRQEEILARHEQLLAMYEARTTTAQGGKQFGVPNLFVNGAAVVEGCPAHQVSAAEWQKIQPLTSSGGKGADAPADAPAAPGKEANSLRGDGLSQDTSLQPEVTNSQLQFLQCLQNSQDCPMGNSQENLFPLSQTTLGASDPLLSCTPLSQGLWGAQASDVGAGATTSHLLASQPPLTAGAGENEGGQ